MNRRQFPRAAPAAPLALVRGAAVAAKPPLLRLVPAATSAEREALLRAIAAIGPNDTIPMPVETALEFVTEVL